MTTPFDRLLRESLKPPPRPPGGGAAAGADRARECLDAEALAAWSEGTLDAAARAAVEAHASECGRCQALLAAMIRTEPVLAARPWWRSPAFGWLVPLTVAAAALTIWVRLDSPPSPQQVAMAPAPAQPGLPAGAGRLGDPSANAKRQETAAAVRPKEEAASAASAAARTEARESLRDQPRDKAGPPVAELDRLDGRREQPALGPPAAPLVPPDVSPEPARERQIVISEAAGRGGAAATDTIARRTAETPPVAGAQPSTTQAAARPVAAPAPPAPAAAPTEAQVTSKLRTTAADASQDMPFANRAASLATQPEVLVQTADGSTRWRITSPGTVLRSIDRGVRWDAQATGEGAVVIAGAAPSPNVCWLVGRRGLVLLTTDGRSWRRVTFPEAVDLVSVAATDDRTATVAAAGGRRFTTTDGGVEWK